MPKQIFQRPAPVKRQNFNKGGQIPGQNRKPPVLPKAAKPDPEAVKSDDNHAPKR